MLCTMLMLGTDFYLLQPVPSTFSDTFRLLCIRAIREGRRIIRAHKLHPLTYLIPRARLGDQPPTPAGGS